MVSLKSILVACAAVTGVVAAPGELPGQHLDKRQNTANGEGRHDGYFYSWWSDRASPATYTNEAGGQYSVTWQSGGNLVGGKGWNPGTARNISYEASFNPTNNGNAYLTIYGWTRNPLVEYYVVEAHGEYNPGNSATRKGTVVHAGTTYNLFQSQRTNQPSIDGTRTFQQYWAIRQQHRKSGTVDMSVIFNAWKNAGMSLGNHYYQVVATEAYRSAGNSRVKITSPP